MIWRWPELSREVAEITAAGQRPSAVPSLFAAAERMNREPDVPYVVPQLALAGRYIEPTLLTQPIGLLRPHAPNVASPDNVPATTPGTADATTVNAPPKRVDDDLAEQAYALLANGQRRAAAARFRSAVFARQDDPRTAAWIAQLRIMERRWSGSAYVFARASGLSGVTAGPVLGGGQSGAQIAYRLNPLAKMPTSLIARATVGDDSPDTAQAALGISWQLLPGLSLAAERLVPVGANARSAWNFRAAGGASTANFGEYGRSVELTAYAEAGMVGLHRRDLYAAATARMGRRSSVGRNGTLVAGVAAWGSVQRSDLTATRLEVGPSLQLRLAVPLAVSLSADYRLRIAGNARPVSGPALTIAASF